MDEGDLDGDSGLFSALRDYTLAALGWLGRCPAAELRIRDPWRSPVEDDPESLLYPDPSGVCAGILHSRRRPIHEEQLHELPEYAKLAEVLERNPSLADVAGHFVSSGGRGRRLYLTDLTDGPLLNMVADSGSLEFSDEVFNEEFARLDSLLCDPVLEHVKLVPLLSFHSELEDVQLDDETSIGLLTPREARLGDRWGYSEGPAGPWWGIRFHRRLPKYVGDDGLTPPADEALRFNTDGPDAVNRVITALRLLKEGVFCAPGLVDESVADYERQGGSTSPFFGDRRSRMDSYSLGAEDARTLQAWWAENRETMRGSLVVYPLSRFSLCGEAQRPEERLVNLAICAESLLLRERENSELTHKLALRAAFLLERPDRSRAMVYRFFKRAYEARSEIVHGNELSPATRAKDCRRLLRLVDGSASSLDQVNAELACLLRELLNMALGLAGHDARLADEADRLIFAS